MVILEILGLFCAIVGIVGCIVPILPGTPICFVGMLLCQWAGAGFATDTLILWAVVAVAVTVLDNFLPVIMKPERIFWIWCSAKPIAPWISAA